MISKRKTFAKSVMIISVLLLILFSFSTCFGDLLGSAYRKHIVGNYYLVGVDTKEDIFLCYETASGDCIGKVPPRVIEYGYSDSVLVTKTIEYGKGFPSYYVIYMRKDSDYAHEENFRIGPLDEKEFDKNWRNKFGIK